MKRPKKQKTVAAKSRSYADAFPKHCRQDAFLAATVALRARWLVGASATPPSQTKAVALARAEFDAAINAVMFPPAERRFYFLWSSAAAARLLIPFTQAAWECAGGEYGERQPIHYDMKRNPSNQ